MKILLVDDDEFLTSRIASHLIEQHYLVDIATTGERCLEYISLFSYDLILLDVLLPDINGKELCRRLRQQNYESPILMLTAQAASEDKVEGLDSGADEYVVKPIVIKELMAHIRALLRRKFTASQSIVKWGQLQLDPSSRQFSYALQPLKLTPKEYSILELLIRNPEQVHTPDSIIESAWSFEDPPSSDAVRTHIKSLRQKLKKRGALKDFIATVYAFGYRLQPNRPSVAIKAEPPTLENLLTDPTDRDMSTAMSKIWKQNQPELRKRLQLLLDLTQALERNDLTPDLFQQSLSAAHKLAGSLGCYGYTEGSSLAKEIELLITEQSTLNDKVEELAMLIGKLQISINVLPHASLLKKHLPFVLAVSKDQFLRDELAGLALQHNINFNSIEQPSQLKLSIAAQAQSLILLDVNPIESVDVILGELQEELARIPIIARLHASNLTERLHLFEQGIQNVIPTSVSAPQIINSINQMIQSWGQKFKILIVDDDPHILSFLETNLANWGLQISTLEDSNHFWPTLEAVNPDLLILDIEMPQPDGLVLCQQIRADGKWQHLPVIILTTRKEESIQNYSFVVGADDFIPKPIEVTTLVNRIQNRLRRQHPKP